MYIFKIRFCRFILYIIISLASSNTESKNARVRSTAFYDTMCRREGV